jgi:hypothetical protein
MNDTILYQDASIRRLKETLKEFSNLTRRLNAITGIDKGPLRLQKRPLSMMGREEARLCIWDKVKEACHADVYEDVHRLIMLTHQSYDQFKGIIEGRYNSHRYITSRAIDLVGVDGEAAEKFLQYSTFPDEPKSDMSDLIFEGHFYGKVGKRKEGNFVDNLFPGVVAVLGAIKKATHGFDEDIHEHAVGNFRKNYDQSCKPGPGRYFCLGVAAHFLQDLTAPHHVGNYPAVPYVDHYFFEKFAGRHVHETPGFSISETGYSNFKRSLKSSLSRPEDFAREIYGKAAAYVKYIETGLHSQLPGTADYTNTVENEVDIYSKYLISGKNPDWEEAVNRGVPLGVYATAYLFEEALKKE